MAFEAYLSLLNEKIEDALLPILVKDLIGFVEEYAVEVAPAKLAQLMQAIFAAFLANKTLPYEEAGVDPSQFKLNDYSPAQTSRFWVAACNKRELATGFKHLSLDLSRILPYGATSPRLDSDGNFLDYMATQLEKIAGGSSGSPPERIGVTPDTNLKTILKSTDYFLKLLCRTLT